MSSWFSSPFSTSKTTEASEIATLKSEVTRLKAQKVEWTRLLVQNGLLSVDDESLNSSTNFVDSPKQSLTDEWHQALGSWIDKLGFSDDHKPHSMASDTVGESNFVNPALFVSRLNSWAEKEATEKGALAIKIETLEYDRQLGQAQLDLHHDEMDELNEELVKARALAEERAQALVSLEKALHLAREKIPSQRELSLMEEWKRDAGLYGSALESLHVAQREIEQLMADKSRLESDLSDTASQWKATKENLQEEMDRLATENSETVRDLNGQLSVLRSNFDSEKHAWAQKDQKYLEDSTVMKTRLSTLVRMIRHDAPLSQSNSTTDMILLLEDYWRAALQDMSQARIEISLQLSKISDLESKLDFASKVKCRLKETLGTMRVEMVDIQEQVRSIVLETGQDLSFVYTACKSFISRTTSENQEAAINVARLNQSLGDLSSALKRCESELEEKQGLLDFITEDLSRTRAALEDMTSIQQIQSAVVDETLERAQEELAEKDSQLRALRGKLEIVDFRKVELELENEGLKESLDEKACKLENLEKGLVNSQNHLQDTMTHLNYISMSLRDEGILDELFGTYASNMMSIAGSLDSFFARIDHLHSQLASFSSTKTFLESQVVELKATLSLRDSELDDAFSELAELSATLEQSHRNLQGKDEELNLLKGQNEQLDAEIEALQLRMEQTMELSVFDERVALMQEEMNIKLSGASQSLQRQIEMLAEAQIRITVLESDNERLVLDKTDLDNQVTTLSNQNAKLQEEAAQNENVLSLLREEHDKVKAALLAESSKGHMSAKVSEISQSLQHYVESHAEAQEEIRRLESETSRLHSEKISLANRISELESLIHSMKEAATQESELCCLREEVQRVMAALADEKSVALTQKEDFEDQIEALKTEIQSKNLEMTSIRQELNIQTSTLSSKLQTLTHEHEKAMITLQSSQDNLVEEKKQLVKALEEQVKLHVSEIADWERIVQEAKDFTHSSLSLILSKLQYSTASDAVNPNLETLLEEMVPRIVSRIEEIGAGVHSAEVDSTHLVRLKQNFDDSQKVVESLLTKVKDLSINFESSQNQAIALTEKISELEAEKSELHSKLNSVDSERIELSNQLIQQNETVIRIENDLNLSCSSTEKLKIEKEELHQCILTEKNAVLQLKTSLKEKEDQIKSLEEAIVVATSSHCNTEMLSQIEICQNQIDSLTVESQAHLLTISGFEQALIEAQKFMEEKEAAAAEKEDQVIKLKDAVKKLEDSLTEKDFTIKSVKEALERQAQQQADSYEARFQIMRDTQVSLKLKLESLSAIQNSIDARFEEQRSQIERLLNENKGLLDKNKEQQQSLSCLESNLKNIEEASISQKEDFSKQIKVLVTEKQILCQEMSAFEEIKEQITHRVQELESNLASQREKMLEEQCRLEQELEKMPVKASTRDETTETEALILENEEAYQILIKKNEAITSRMSSLEAALSQQSLEFRGQVQKMEDEKSNLECALQDLEATLNRRNSAGDTSELVLDLKVKEGKINELLSEIQNLMTRTKLSEKESDTLYQRIAEQEIQMRQWKLEAQQNSSECSSSHKITGLNKTISKLESGLSEMTEKCKTLEANAKETVELNDALNEKYLSLLKRNKKLEVVVMKLHKQLESRAGTDENHILENQTSPVEDSKLPVLFSQCSTNKEKESARKTILKRAAPQEAIKSQDPSLPVASKFRSLPGPGRVPMESSRKVRRVLGESNDGDSTNQKPECNQQ